MLQIRNHYISANQSIPADGAVIEMIRKATFNDTKEFCQVLRISITELCKKDYENNDEILESGYLIKQLKIVKNGFWIRRPIHLL